MTATSNIHDWQSQSASKDQWNSWATNRTFEAAGALQVPIFVVIVFSRRFAADLSGSAKIVSGIFTRSFDGGKGETFVKACDGEDGDLNSLEESGGGGDGGEHGREVPVQGSKLECDGGALPQASRCHGWQRTPEEQKRLADKLDTRF
jgi:hypothetical protein